MRGAASALPGSQAKLGRFCEGKGQESRKRPRRAGYLMPPRLPPSSFCQAASNSTGDAASQQNSPLFLRFVCDVKPGGLLRKVSKEGTPFSPQSSEGTEITQFPLSLLKCTGKRVSELPSFPWPGGWEEGSCETGPSSPGSGSQTPRSHTPGKARGGRRSREALPRGALRPLPRLGRSDALPPGEGCRGVCFRQKAQNSAPMRPAGEGRRRLNSEGREGQAGRKRPARTLPGNGPPSAPEWPAMEALREALREALAGLPGGGGGGGGEEEAAFDRARFWEALAGAFGAASREATRLSLAAAARDPQACERLSEELRDAVLGAVSVYQQLPQSQGKTLNNAVRCATIQVVEGMIQLTEVILRTPQESLSQEQLISTGGVWEACDRVSCLPHDNLAAVTLAISSCLELVKDALEEMEQMQAEGGASPGDLLEDEMLGFPGNCAFSWTDAERQLLGPCKGLVKATKAGLRKLLGAMRTHGRADLEEQVAQLDALAEVAVELSPSVDELVLSLCPPVNQLTLRLNAGKLASVLMRMLEITRTSHVCPPSEESWVRFLAGAVDHNLGKIKDYTQGLLGDPGPVGEGQCMGDARPKEQP